MAADYVNQWNLFIFSDPMILLYMLVISECHGDIMAWKCFWHYQLSHYSDVIMGAMASQITSLTIVYSTVYSGADQRKHQSSASLSFVRGIHRWPVNSQHKWPVTQKMFPSDNVIVRASNV